MPETYVRRHGVDWPVGMHPAFIDLTVAKKHKLLQKQYGIEFPDPHVRLLDAARALLPEGAFVVSPWSEQHAYDFVHHRKNVTWGCASCSKSNDYGLFTVLHWIVDPYTTVCLVGSTSLKALQSRTWESIVRYHAHLKVHNAGKLTIPGKFSRTGYAVINESDQDVAESQGSKASIQGRALNDGGTLQGAHLPYVLLLVDEAATIADQSIVQNAMVNLRSGAIDFRVFMLANPEDWADPSCQYCEPDGGVSSVDVDTGEWVSTQGFHVRHHDGLKSPRVLHPEREDWSHLLGPEDVAESLLEARGNMDAPIIWKMVRGFPRPALSSAETVLEYAEASARKCMEPYAPTGRDFVAAVAAGCDPAWSPDGDEAVWQKVEVVVGAGVPYLVFKEPERLEIMSSSKDTPLEQMSRRIVDLFLADRALDPSDVAYDSSGNQSLCGAVAMRTGVHGMDVNSSERASERPVGEGRPAAKEKYRDRAAEAWAVLAEFVRAGQVRGLSRAAVEQLCSRRWATVSARTSALMRPLKLESKEAWAARERRAGGPKSPNQCDAAAVAALAVKERLGYMPWSNAVPAPRPSGILPGYPDPDVPVAPDADVAYGDEWVPEEYFS